MPTSPTARRCSGRSVTSSERAKPGLGQRIDAFPGNRELHVDPSARPLSVRNRRDRRKLSAKRGAVSAAGRVASRSCPSGSGSPAVRRSGSGVRPSSRGGTGRTACRVCRCRDRRYRRRIRRAGRERSSHWRGQDAAVGVCEVEREAVALRVFAYRCRQVHRVFDRARKLRPGAVLGGQRRHLECAVPHGSSHLDRPEPVHREPITLGDVTRRRRSGRSTERRSGGLEKNPSVISDVSPSDNRIVETPRKVACMLATVPVGGIRTAGSVAVLR